MEKLEGAVKKHRFIYRLLKGKTEVYLSYAQLRTESLSSDSSENVPDPDQTTYSLDSRKELSVFDYYLLFLFL